MDLRRVASEWHGGQTCPLYAFASTGSIAWDLDITVNRIIGNPHKHTVSPRDREALEAILALAEAAELEWIKANPNAEDFPDYYQVGE